MTDLTNTSPQLAPQQKLAHFPITLFASVMGMSGLALAMHAAASHFGWGSFAPRVALAVAVMALVAIAGFYLVKALLYPRAVAEEWQHPVKLNFFPAIPISLMLVASGLRFEWGQAALVLWGVGALLQAGLALAVISTWIGPRGFGLGQVTPAWFIPAVGNVVVPVAGVPLGFVDVSWLFFAAGMVFWAALLPILLQRLITEAPLPGKLQPTLAILVAPPAVAFLSYVALNGGVLDGFARILFNSAWVFSALVMVQLVQRLRGPFALSWWALSFPVAALTISCFRYASLAETDLHGLMGTGALAALIVIIVGLVLRTGLGMTRGEICRPD